MVAILTESDFAKRTVNLDAAYVYGDATFGNLFTVAASSIRRHYGHHNTYNTSLHLLASIPEGRTTPYADRSFRRGRCPTCPGSDFQEVAGRLLHLASASSFPEKQERDHAS